MLLMAQDSICKNVIRDYDVFRYTVFTLLIQRLKMGLAI